VPLKQKFAAALLALATLAVLVQIPLAFAGRSHESSWLGPLMRAHELIVRDFVGEVDQDAMEQAMIAGMVRSLDDPYTVYVPPGEAEDFTKEVRGTYVGIGAEVLIVDDRLTIVTPLAGSPALERGVRAGDVVLTIDGQSTYKRPVDDCIDRLMGREGTSVSIRVRHADGAEEDLVIERRQIVTQTVMGIQRRGDQWEYCLERAQGVYYIRITQFNESTLGELRAALNDIGAGNLRGLIVDVRDDPGGSLVVAIELADLFLEQGVIVSVKGRDGDGRSWHARREGTLPEFPMLVLINESSASASEIFAGSLQAAGRAKVLGMRSFGKASVQEIRELGEGDGTLKLTTAYYQLAGGRTIHRQPDSPAWGVDPDPGFVVPVSGAARRAMIEARREQDIIRSAEANDAALPEGGCYDAAWVREHLKDEQLALAITAMQGRLTTGLWPAVSDLAAQSAAMDVERDELRDARRRLLEQLGQLDQRLAELGAAPEATTTSESP
jgi:carboxyl-terminal processing protease